MPDRRSKGPQFPRGPSNTPLGPKAPGGRDGGISIGDPPLPAPVVLAIGVTSLKTTGVTLVGAINTFGLPGEWWFTWGPTPQCGAPTASAAVSGAVPITVQFTLTGLATNITYYFALVGQSAGGRAQSVPMSFTTNTGNVPTVASAAPATTPATVVVPHFSWPFTIVTGTRHIQYGTQITSSDGAKVVEQDSDGDVLTCVTAIVECTTGEWTENPSFGIPDFAFSEVPLDTLGLGATITRWEPRATTDIVSDVAAGTLDQVWNVAIDVQAGTAN